MRLSPLAWCRSCLSGSLTFIGLLSTVVTTCAAVAHAEPPGTKALWYDRLEVGATVRWRGEYRYVASPTGGSGYAAAGNTEDADLGLLRTRVSVKSMPGASTSFAVVLQESRGMGQGGGVSGSPATSAIAFDTHESWIAWGNAGGIDGLSLKIGRTPMAYGDQRLVSSLEWSNVGRTWDGGWLAMEGNGWWVEGFTTLQTEGLQDINTDASFDGIYLSVGSNRTGTARGTVAAGHDALLDVGLLRLDDRTTAYTAEDGVTTGPQRLHALTVRYHATTSGAPNVSRWSWTLELIGESGRRAGDRVSASAAAALISYDCYCGSRVAVEFNWASGDENGTDGKVQRFNPLYPFSHAFQGHADVIGWINATDLRLMFSIPIKTGSEATWTFHADLHALGLARESDAWFSVAGGAVRAASPGASRDLARELDLYMKGKVSETAVWGGFSYVVPGPSMKRTDPNVRAQRFLFLMLTWSL